MAQELRFAVGTAEAVQSTIWRLWAKKDDLYLAGRSYAGQVKISFHKSGICRIAGTSTEPRPALAKWTRPKRAGPGAIPLFAIHVPALEVKDAFREHLPPPAKKVDLIEPPAAGMKTIIFILASEREHTSGQFTFLRDGAPTSIVYQTVGRLNLTSEIVWVFAYQEVFKEEERKIVQGELRPLKAEKITVNGSSGAVNYATLHSYQTQGYPPAVTDLLLGPEHFNFPDNET